MNPNLAAICTAQNSPKLLDQMRDKLWVNHYSLGTEKQYLQWAGVYSLHGKRHPRDMGRKSK